MEGEKWSDINEIGAAIKAGLAILAPANVIKAIALGAEFSDSTHALLLRGLFNCSIEVLLLVVLGGEVFSSLWDVHRHCLTRVDARLSGTCNFAFDRGRQSLGVSAWWWWCGSLDLA